MGVHVIPPHLRKSTPAIGGESPKFIITGNPHVFGYARQEGVEQVLILNNFSDDPQTISGNTLRSDGLGQRFTDLVEDKQLDVESDLTLEPF